MWTRILKPVNRAGQRLSQCRMLERHMIRNMQCILGNDAGWNADEFRIRSIIEEQIVAKIFLAVSTEVALPARRGIESHHSIASEEVGDPFAGLHYGTGQFVAK